MDVADDPAMFRVRADRNGEPLHNRGSPMKKPRDAPVDQPVRILEALQDARCSLLHNQCLGAAGAECAAQAFLLASKLIDRMGKSASQAFNLYDPLC